MNTDILIIGAGLIGTSTALQLAMRGCRCIVIDKASPGRHASGSNAGGLRQLNRDLAEIPLSVAAAKMWHNIENLVDSDCDARFPGQIRVAENQSDMHKLEQRAAMVRSMGYQHEEMIGRKELFQIVPALAPHCIGALICREDGYARPYHALTAFRQKAESLGASFHSDCEVYNITQEGDGWSVRTSQGTYNSSIVVNCAGAWAGELAAQMQEPVPLTPKALMLMVTERLPHFVDPVMGAESRKLSFKQMQNGTLIIGGALVAKLDFEQERTDIDWQQLAASAKTVLDFFPQLQDVRIVRAWAGIEGFMPDNIPVISASHKANNAYHAFGFSAHGLQLSPVIGLIMAQLILDGLSELPIEPFSISRFNH
ncbi:sarcosine oxidase, subunit beta [Bathymodiolus japonicus methanotrophic gill symbiont]|uniref:NAD(P)/FAD-dependent oxidoreductase n=1 Tax=Bathymodiolus japonicus methanotrophic gill symbiont TaxID=113269 RepID=UPI001B62E934|nr:FAD-dependent oxidoreductase [Bathymodiolus japonicus methanotrophic gill symbiont]GFO71816.1 sarcosine oxidase, subunit beta [Bathymodiolus japonicus methanotrophic gill symbiont]